MAISSGSPGGILFRVASLRSKVYHPCVFLASRRKNRTPEAFPGLKRLNWRPESPAFVQTVVLVCGLIENTFDLPAVNLELIPVGMTVIVPVP